MVNTEKQNLRYVEIKYIEAILSTEKSNTLLSVMKCIVMDMSLENQDIQL